MSGPRFDIRRYKKDLRNHYRKLRSDMDPQDKVRWDNAILQRILDMPIYRTSQTLLTFVSTAIEVDTHQLIRQSLELGKNVAVPYCVEGTRKMDFYLIHSLEELEVRTYGVLEPVAEKHKKLTDFSSSLCILPGLAFDVKGYRLGYGGGYYDRFLSQVYTGHTVGVCYKSCTRGNLIHGQYDVPCQWLVTEGYTKSISPNPSRKKRPAAKPK